MTASDKCHHVSPERRRTEAAAAQIRSRVLLPTIFNIAEGYVILTNPPHPPNIHLCVCFLFFSFFLLTHSSLSRGKTRHRSPAIPVLLMPRRCHLGAPVAPRRRCAGRVCVCVCARVVCPLRASAMFPWTHRPPCVFARGGGAVTSSGSDRVQRKGSFRSRAVIRFLFRPWTSVKSQSVEVLKLF